MKTENILNPLATLILFCITCLLPVAEVWAQQPTAPPSVQMREDFSDDELQSFVNANEKVIVIQMEGEQKMIKAIEDEGLTVDRFHEILEHQRDPNRATETKTSPEELKSFNNAAQVILQENAKLEERMTSSIEEEGIDIETYQQIMVAYQQNPGIQNRVNKMLNGEN